MNIPGLAGGSRGVFLDRIARLGTSLSERSRRMRDFATIEVMNEHGLRDLGLWRDRDGQNGHLTRF